MSPNPNAKQIHHNPLLNIPLQEQRKQLPEELLQEATQHHMAGRFSDAETLYQQILDLEPDQTEALHRLGVLAYQIGNLEQGLLLIERAVALKPDAFTYHSHLGMILVSLNRLEEAIASYGRALQLKPGVPDILNNMAVALQTQGDTEGAIAAYREALQAQPDLPQASMNLGSIYSGRGQFIEAAEIFRAALLHQPNDADLHFQLGNAFYESAINKSNSNVMKPGASKFDAAKSAGEDNSTNDLQEAILQETIIQEAIAAFQQAVSLRPEWAQAVNNLGIALKQAGDSENALACFGKAILLQPDFAAAHFNLGEALFQCGRLHDATAAYQNALALDPNSPQTHNNLGITLCDLGMFEEAVASFRLALALRPDYSEACNNLGNALKAAGRLNEAISVYRVAIVLRPNDAAVWNNLGCSLISQGDVDEALGTLRKSLELRPDSSEALANLGNALKDQGDLDTALVSYERALALKPDCQETHSNRLYTLNFHPSYSREAIYKEHKRWNSIHAEPLRPKDSVHSHYDNDRSPDRRLRIGYVAPDFREHCQSLFTIPLLAHHDHSAFEIIAYSNVAAPDAVTDQIRGYCDGWRDILGLTDCAAADLIRGDKIDILLDLTLHMARNRLQVFARKPAPVQVTWLGYPGTTGLTAIDYRLTDPYLDPPNEKNDASYSEKSICLPDTFWCYDPRTREPAVNALPASQNGYITFGCLNNFCKINEPTLQLWASVMQAVPHSKLLLLAPTGTARSHVLAILHKHGIEGSRVEFVGRQPRSRYLEYYHRIDIGLDTIPYNGHTTSLDSLWMGVPVITLVGHTAAGRAGWSQLSNLKLPHLAATTEADFVRVTQQVAWDQDGLAALRHSLRERMQHSPLMNAPRFARHMEAAYHQMWHSRTTDKAIQINCL